MDVDRTRRVDAVLDAVLTREPTQWPALLDEACSGDPELRREVEALLARLDTASRFLDSPPGAIAAALVAESRESESGLAADSFTGRRIGAYRVDRELGRGGMSRVFLAERADGEFEQQVALKLLRPGLDSDLDLARLRAERQILASLNHPNIARLFDGGVTDEGLPYLVMEYIDGQPLDRYCEERGLTIRQRLEIFRTVAEATEYAHRNLVVHRDLKPSNILVTADGTVKLLDFGLAKLLEPDARTPMPTTRAGHGWMTPEYAAPEQISGTGVNTVTDVYQLGVVLYELLAGRLPFAHHRSLYELQTAILGEEPAPPSAAVLRARAAGAPNDSGATGEPGDVARARSRALRGDLDAIVMKALHKEPDRRYPSAAALREDLSRHIEGRVVAARPDRAGYRLRKFVRRHRGGVVVAAAARHRSRGGSDPGIPPPRCRGDGGPDGWCGGAVPADRLRRGGSVPPRRYEREPEYYPRSARSRGGPTRYRARRSAGDSGSPAHRSREGVRQSRPIRSGVRSTPARGGGAARPHRRPALGDGHRAG